MLRHSLYRLFSTVSGWKSSQSSLGDSGLREQFLSPRDLSQERMYQERMSLNLEDFPFSLEITNKMICQVTPLSGCAQCDLKAKSWDEILIRHLGPYVGQTDIESRLLQRSIISPSGHILQKQCFTTKCKDNRLINHGARVIDGGRGSKMLESRT